MKNGLHSVIYLLYNSKLISVLHIGYINVQIIGIGYKKNLYWSITNQNSLFTRLA